MNRTATHTQLLREPIRLGPIVAGNRLVMPPLVIWKSNQRGLVADTHIEHYARSQGAGLVIVEATAIRPEGRLAATQLGIWDDTQIEGLATLAETIARNGAIPGIQIHHAGGRTNRKNTYDAPPRVPSLSAPQVPEGSIEMDDAMIEDVVSAFAGATRRAIAAGYRVVELHGAHGYLISQFLSPATNLRTDEWGGSAEARRRFMTACIAAARREVDVAAAAHPDSPVALGIRLGIAASGPQRLDIDEGLAAARAAVEAGVDLLNISNAGGIDEETSMLIRARAGEESSQPDGTPASAEIAAVDRQPASDTLLLAKVVKEQARVPVIGVGGVRTPEMASRVVEEGIADMVAVGRGILADPRWAAKALGDDDRAIETCRDCKPRCRWFPAPEKCPARIMLARRGEQPQVR